MENVKAKNIADEVYKEINQMKIDLHEVHENESISTKNARLREILTGFIKKYGFYTDIEKLVGVLKHKDMGDLVFEILWGILIDNIWNGNIGDPEAQQRKVRYIVIFNSNWEKGQLGNVIDSNARNYSINQISKKDTDKKLISDEKQSIYLIVKSFKAGEGKEKLEELITKEGIEKANDIVYMIVNYIIYDYKERADFMNIFKNAMVFVYAKKINNEKNG